MRNRSIDNSVNGNLTNLTPIGRNLANWSSNVSNCPAEIPQNIKLELNNGTLTLKAGSVITYPDGTQSQLTSDKSITSSSNGKKVVFVHINASGLAVGTLSNCCSGATDDLAGVAFHTWYDTTNNVIQQYNSTGTEVSAILCLPIAIVTVSNGAISSIDQLFNGAGYIGHHAFLLKDVQGFNSDGINPNGTLKSIKTKISNLSVIELQNTSTSITHGCIAFDTSNAGSRLNYFEVETTQDVDSIGLQGVYYVRKENLCYSWGGGSSTKYPKFLRFIDYDYNGTTVTKFDVRQPVRLFTTEMFDNSKADIVRWCIPDYESGVSITSPYTPTKDGIIIAEKNAGYSTAEIKITDGITLVRHQSADSSSSNNVIWANVKSGVSYTISAGTMTFYPFIGA